MSVGDNEIRADSPACSQRLDGCPWWLEIDAADRARVSLDDGMFCGHKDEPQAVLGAQLIRESQQSAVKSKHWAADEPHDDLECVEVVLVQRSILGRKSAHRIARLRDDLTGQLARARGYTLGVGSFAERRDAVGESP